MTIIRTPYLAAALLLALLAPAMAQDKIADNDRVAIVRSNGSLKDGVGIVSTTRTSTGQDQVKIDRAISRCACLVTRGSPTEPLARSGYAICHMRTGLARTFHIRLFNEEGTVEDGPFMLLAACIN